MMIKYDRWSLFNLSDFRSSIFIIVSLNLVQLVCEAMQPLFVKNVLLALAYVSLRYFSKFCGIYYFFSVSAINSTKIQFVRKKVFF